ncbi:flagellin lysine-N-methylase [Oceanispirochaeta sp.]|jgi:lysine-N-methylase|uniref:flagellin lysine-N-methylase n=1 Tax=Oceanispirochaeta sp. TaxID=2035350 RepID=UPI00261A6514|nr:flagellin lysine-N-methylase [Oceanispirochaeta sp.]MDA3958797.1 flagellin lysine-N-methylase [Oceanispirochaeta sp.]
MKKLTRIITPSYVSGFKCIAGACEDSCCIGWDIDIDKLTYRKYFRTKNLQMKQEFVKHVYRNEDCDFEEVDYGRVRINKSKYCPFLDNQRLCRIYTQLGEDSLSNVCTSYPRVYNLLDDVYELSLFLSCPEAVRKLFASQEPIRFIEEELPLDRHILHSHILTHDKRWQNSPVRRLKELRSRSIEMIQDRNHSITERVLRLGRELSRSGSSWSGSPGTGLKSNRSFAFQFEFFKEAIETLHVSSEIDSALFARQTNKVITGLRFQDASPISEKAKLYEQSLTMIVEPFLIDHGYLFEHYLVNFMFQGNFPFTENQNVLDGYLMMVIRYTFIRFYLAGIGVLEGKITEEDIILMIQLFTKTIEHHKTFIIDLLQEIKNKKLDNMDFIRTLLMPVE